MKKKKAIVIFSISVLISLGIIFKSETVYLYELTKIIIKIKRTNADITDYKYFDNITIPKSKKPKSWPLHNNFNEVISTKNLIAHTKIWEQLLF